MKIIVELVALCAFHPGILGTSAFLMPKGLSTLKNKQASDLLVSPSFASWGAYGAALAPKPAASVARDENQKLRWLENRVDSLERSPRHDQPYSYGNTRSGIPYTRKSMERQSAMQRHSESQKLKYLEDRLADLEGRPRQAHFRSNDRYQYGSSTGRYGNSLGQRTNSYNYNNYGTSDNRYSSNYGTPDNRYRTNYGDRYNNNNNYGDRYGTNTRHYSNTGGRFSTSAGRRQSTATNQDLNRLEHRLANLEGRPRRNNDYYRGPSGRTGVPLLGPARQNHQHVDGHHRNVHSRTADRYYGNSYGQRTTRTTSNTDLKWLEDRLDDLEGRPRRGSVQSRYASRTRGQQRTPTTQDYQDLEWLEDRLADLEGRPRTRAASRRRPTTTQEYRELVNKLEKRLSGLERAPGYGQSRATSRYGTPYNDLLNFQEENRRGARYGQSQYGRTMNGYASPDHNGYSSYDRNGYASRYQNGYTSHNRVRNQQGYQNHHLSDWEAGVPRHNNYGQPRVGELTHTTHSFQGGRDSMRDFAGL